MLKTLYLLRGSLKESDIKDFSKKMMVLDCHNPSQEELKKLSKNLQIPLDELNKGLDEDERPHVYAADNYVQITVSAPFKIKEEMQTASFSMFLTATHLLIIRRREFEAVDAFFRHTEARKVDMLKKDPGYMAYEVLHEVMQNFFTEMDKLEESMDKLEEQVFKSSTKRIMERCFTLKKTLIYFHRSLNANRELLTMVDKTPELKTNYRRNFRYLLNDANQLIDLASTFRDIMTGIIDMHLSSESKNLNEVMKRLTVYASYILVPTLISGIYGMNFRFMPELKWKYGYLMSLFIMLFSVIALHMYFKRKGWI